MKLLDWHEVVELAAHTPHSEPVGLTAYEIAQVKKAFGNPEIVGAMTLFGRRVVRIPWDWERQLHVPRR